jgi:YD repeat-containing protein
MSKLFRVVDAAAHDARRAEALMYDARARRTLRTDPDSALLAFELHVSAIGDETGEREGRKVQRDGGVRAGRRTAVV